MPYDGVLFAFHGGAHTDETAGKLWENVSKGLLKKYFFESPGQFFRLLSAAPTLYSMTKSYKRGEIEYEEIYDFFNPRVLRGLPRDHVDYQVRKYAVSDKNRRKLQTGILNAVQGAKNEGKFTGTISTNYHKFIEDTLGPGWLCAVDVIDANDMKSHQVNGVEIIDDFVLSNYQNKGERFELMRADNNIEGNVVVLMDTDEDEEILQRDRERVIPVVSHLAKPDFKQHCAVEHDAEVLKKQEDFGKFLKKI